MAENPTKDEQQTSDTNKYITLHLIGAPLTIAGAASTATSASYLVYEVVNHKKFIQTVLHVIERYGVEVFEVGPDTIRIIASSKNVAKIENAVKSSKLLEEINQRIVQYNEETKDKVQNLTDLKIWKSMKKKSKQNVDEVLEKGFRPYEIPESALLHRSTKRKPVNIQPTSSNQQPRCKEMNNYPLESFPHNEEWVICKSSVGNKIYYCTDSSGNNLFIKKIMYKPQHGNMAKLETFLRYCRTEVNIFRPLQESSYILKYITHKESGESFEIVTELCHGNVFEFVKCLSLRCEGKSSNEWPQPLPRVEKIPDLKEFANESDQDYLSFFDISPMQAVMQMIEGINVMHSVDFVHQDIKPQNFLLKKWETQTYVKVCDFGISKKLNEGSSTVKGTPSWMPPELLQAKRAEPSLKSDIFSLGLVLFYTLTNGKHPYGTLPFEQDSNIYKGTEPELQYLFEGDLTEEKINACGLIYWMLSHKPEDRPTMEEVKCHPFLWNYDEKVEFLEKIGNLIANNKSAKDKDNTHAIKSSQAQPRSDIDEGNSSKPCSSESHTEGRVISDGQPIKTEASALNPKEPTNLELLSQKFLKLESYPAWMSSGYWTTSGEKSSPTEQKKFNKTIEQIREMHRIMPHGKKEPTERPNPIQQLLVTMRHKRQHCNGLPDNAEDVEMIQDCDKFFPFCTKNNPQMLLNTYEVFRNEPWLQKFKEKMRRQDRGKRH